MTDLLPRKPIADATFEEVKRYAEQGNGLNCSGLTDHAAIVAKLSEAGILVDEIPILKDRAAEGQVSGYVRASSSGRTFWREENFRDADNNLFKWREYALIQIPNQPIPGGKDPVSVNVNGRNMFIPRGQPSSVPVEYVAVLQDAVEIEWESDDVHGLRNPRPVQRYPFSYLPVPEGEIITPPDEAQRERDVAAKASTAKYTKEKEAA